MKRKFVDKSVRKQAYLLVGLQAILVIFVAIVWGFAENMLALRSTLLGGAAVVLPSFYFAWRLFAQMSAKNVAKIIQTFYIGELTKLVLSGILVVVVVKFVHIAPLPFFIGYLVALLAFWTAPLFMRAL